MKKWQKIVVVFVGLFVLLVIGYFIFTAGQIEI